MLIIPTKRILAVLTFAATGALSACATASEATNQNTAAASSKAASVEAPYRELERRIGDWTGTVITPLPDGGQLERRAEETVWAHGPYFIYSSFISYGKDGNNYEGRGTYGYDPDTSEYVETWINNVSPLLVNKKGNFTNDGAVLTVKWMEPGPDGVLTPHHSEEKRSADAYIKSYFRNGEVYATINMKRSLEGQ